MRRSILTCWVCLSAAGAAWGETHIVFPYVGGEFPTIQAAVDYAQDGDTVALWNGVFSGEGNCNVDYLGKDITIRSYEGDPEACIIDCGGEHRAFLMDELGDGGTLEFITIRNGGGVIRCSGESSPLIYGCMFRGNHSLQCGGAAVACSDGACPRIVNCVFTENTEAAGSGVVGVNGGSVSLQNCTFARNLTWTAIDLFSSEQSWIRNTIIEGTVHYAVFVQGTPPAMKACDLYGNGAGNWIGPIADQYPGNGNLEADPVFCDPEGGDFHLHVDSPCAGRADVLNGIIGAYGVGCGWGAECPEGERDATVVSRTGELQLTSMPGRAGAGVRIEFSLPTMGGSHPSPVGASSRDGWPAGATIDDLNASGPMELGIYEVTGRRLRHYRMTPGGRRQGMVCWDGCDAVGSRVSPGIYYCTLAWQGRRTTSRILVVR